MRPMGSICHPEGRAVCALKDHYEQTLQDDNIRESWNESGGLRGAISHCFGANSCDSTSAFLA